MGKDQGTFQPLDDLKGWAEYVGEYEPVLLVQASPRLKETFLSAFSRGMASSHGYIPGPANLHFKTDFYKMKLLCGKQEVKPLFPGKVEHVADVHDASVNITDATFDGLYKYPANAISPACGTVTLEVFSEKEPNQPKAKVLDQKTVNAAIADFAPYMALHASPTDSLTQSPGVGAKQVQIPTSQAEGLSQQTPTNPVRVGPVGQSVAKDIPLAGVVEGMASITSDPNGAQVFIDSAGYGRTPALVKLKTGKHRVQLVADGRKDWVGEIDVKGDSTAYVNGKLEK